MKATQSKHFAVVGLIAAMLILSGPIRAQITINLPKFPKIKKEKPQSSTDTSSSNSGGPYDEETFKSIISDTGYDEWGGYGSFISPYLDCYGKKHNLSADTVDGWAKIHGPDNDQALALGQRRLAELEAKLKSRMRSFPDTGLAPGNNPAIYYEIATKRTEYLACFRDANKPAARDCHTDAVAQVHLGDLEKTRIEAEEFTPGLRGYYVSTLSDSKNLYLEAALSPKKRAEWLGKWPADFLQCLTPALDGLAATAKKTLPGYTGPAGYTLGTPAEKKALQSAVDLSGAKVLKVGLKQPNWLIDKNGLGIPNSRFRHGVIWAQYPNDDTGFCWIFWVNLIQDYAGGGTYGASYGSYISRAVAGCPKS